MPDKKKPQKKLKIQRILGIDPGLETIGYGLVESNSLEHSLVYGGVIQTSKNDKIEHRLSIIYERLTDIIEEYKPQVVAIEKLFFFRNVTSVMKVSQAQGALLLAIYKQKLEIFEYTPLHIKSIITGYGRADKKDVQVEVRQMLSITEEIKDDNHADALAVALTHALQMYDEPKPA